MAARRPSGAAAAALIALAVTASAADPPPDWLPSLSLSFVDADGGARVECGSPCRRFEAPAGATLELRVAVANLGGDPKMDGPPWELWWNQRLHPFPGFDTAACMRGDPPAIDGRCWAELLQRVDWTRWRSETPNLACVPEEPGDCSDVTLRVPLGEGPGSVLAPGTYSLALWVDRFQAVAESDELNNFAGPVRLVVTAAPSPGTPDTMGSGPGDSSGVELVGGGTLVAGSSARPFAIASIPGHAESSFTLTSTRAPAVLHFVVGQPGRVTVEVDQIGSWDPLRIEVRKRSTGEVLQTAGGRGKVSFDGVVGRELLRDERTFEVVVTPEHGTRGARGTIRVSYPIAVQLVAHLEGADTTR